MENTVKAGEVLLQGLKDAQVKFPGLVHSARGLGTFCAIDADTPARYGLTLEMIRIRIFQILQKVLLYDIYESEIQFTK